MVLGDTEYHVHHRPAVRVGGQRQRNRLSRVPRSNTVPNFNQVRSITGNVTSNVGLTPSASSQEGANATPQQEGMSVIETSQSMMNFDSPSGIAANLRPPPQDRRRGASNESRTPIAGSASTSSTSIEGTKKNGFRVPFRTSSRMPPPLHVESSPIPPNTPTKAAKLLGLPHGERTGSPLVAQHDGIFDGSYDNFIKEPERTPTVYGWSQQYFAPDPVASSDSLTSASRKEGIDNIAPKSKGFWNSKKKQAEGLVNTNQPNIHVHDPHVPTSRAGRPSSHRHNRNRTPSKNMAMMPPVNEMPRHHMSAYRPVNEHTEAGTVQEEATTDLTTEKENEMVPGRPADLRKSVSVVPVQSPLQTLEGQCLDATEHALLRNVRSHKDLKGECIEIMGCECGHNIGDSDDDDVISIASSIDLDEYQSMHTVVTMTVRRVLPGEVKLITIPARKK